MTPHAAFASRRQRLIERMTAQGGGVAIVPTAPEVLRNRDSHYPYRFDSYFWYLSGFPEPEAVVVLVAGGRDAKAQAILFCREKIEEREIWEGVRCGPEAAPERYGFDAAYPIGELDARLPVLLENQPAVHFAFGASADWDTRLAGWLATVRAQARAGKNAPTAIVDVRSELDAMRLVKDTHEVALLQRAADIASAAHRRAMSFTNADRHEYEVEAEFLHEFRRQGADGPSYPCIVAGGDNACCLHYSENRAPLRAGTLLLIDAGCEVEGYASDITRSFPVDGRFVGIQKAAYEIVLAAQQAAIDAIRPGASFLHPHEAALRVLAQGLLDLGALTGSLDAVLEQESYKRFYMHRTSHWLGLDVHDAGRYRDGESWTPLAPGMALTVEPGLYFRPAADLPAGLAGVGIRIEDDVLVTEAGARVLTTAPKAVADIEAVMTR
jgi:Xaa-Pro aminopeptidase